MITNIKKTIYSILYFSFNWLIANRENENRESTLVVESAPPLPGDSAPPLPAERKPSTSSYYSSTNRDNSNAPKNPFEDDICSSDDDEK